MKKINWPMWAGAVVALMLVVAVCYVAMTHMNSSANGNLTCDATTVRERSKQTWDRMMAPSMPLPPVDMRIFDTFTSFTSEDKSSKYERYKMTIKYRPNTQPLAREEVLYTLAPPENAASPTSPSLARLIAMGMEKEESLQTPGGGRRKPDMVQYFLPDGTAITTTTFVRMVGNDNQLTSFYSQGRVKRRELRLIFQLDQSRNAKIMSCGVWDSKTHYRYTSGWSMRGGKNGIVNMQPTGPFWRDAKVDVLIDISHGATIDRTLKPDLGATANFGMATVRVIDQLKNRSGSGYSMSSSGTEQEYQYNMQETTGTTLLLVGISPECLIPLFDVAILYEGEEKPKSSWLEERGAFAIVSITKPMDQVKHLEFKLRTNVERKVITIDHLPGMSAVNMGKTDLLDVVVPIAHFSRDFEMQQFLENMLMLSDLQVNGFSHGSHGAPKWSFPITLKEPTVRDVLDVYRSAFPGAECVIDERDARLIIRKPLDFGGKMEEMFDNIGRVFTGRP